MTDLEKAARQALDLCVRIRDGREVWGQHELRAVCETLRAALTQQAEPVSAPPKSFRVGYMTGWDDGQRELREKQQAEPVAIPGAIPMAEVAARSRAMPERAAALEAARERQAEPVALNYARQLAESIWNKHYNNFPQWKPLDDLMGVLTQIDNMTTGLTRQQAEPVVEPSYFGLTKDHTWLSIDKAQYDKLKPRGRMACIVRSEK
jgi:hypothetical protein